MNIEYRSHYSGTLGREMYFNKYGHGGVPIIVFPSSGGSHNEYADFGMIEAAASFIERGLVQFYTPESMDKESWLSQGKSPHDMAYVHNLYDKYIVDELIPLVRYESNWQGGVIGTGCSMGAYHAANFALRHPDVFTTCIAYSGVYDIHFFTEEYYGDISVYQNSPIEYLWNMSDDWFLSRYRQNEYIIAVGQGAWEGPHVQDTRRLQEVFAVKDIPAWFDYWGHDVAHDWDWWRIQIRYHLGILEEQRKI